MVRIFLPKYTPQLNPIEILWRDLKRALAGSYDFIDELKAAITEIVQSGELHPTKLMDCMLPDGAKELGHVPSRHDVRGMQRQDGRCLTNLNRTVPRSRYYGYVHATLQVA